jgi:hypothetical protein
VPDLAQLLVCWWFIACMHVLGCLVKVRPDMSIECSCWEQSISSYLDVLGTGSAVGTCFRGSASSNCPVLTVSNGSIAGASSKGFVGHAQARQYTGAAAH